MATALENRADAPVIEQLLLAIMALDSAELEILRGYSDQAALRQISPDLSRWLAELISAELARRDDGRRDGFKVPDFAGWPGRRIAKALAGVVALQDATVSDCIDGVIRTIWVLLSMHAITALQARDVASSN